MPTVLKNILSFTGLVIGVPSVQAHGINLGGRAVVPKVIEADGDGYTITADDTNVTVTRGANGAAAVNVYCDYWHSILDAEPQSAGIATSIYPFIVQGGGSGGVGVNGLTALSGGTTIATGPAVVFQNGGNVTFGINGNTITASVQTAGGTATGVGLSAGTQSQATGAVVFSNSNNISFGMSNSSVITASFSTAPETPFGVSAGTQSVSTGTIVFSNSNGVTFGLSGSSRITASYSQSTAPNAIAVNGAGSVTAGTVVFSNSNNVTWGLNGSTITASVANGGETPFGVSAGTQSVSTGTVIFGNSNGVTFGLSGSSQVTASFSSLVFSNSNNVSFGVNGSTLTATASMSSVVFSNSNGVTFGLNGSTMTASYSTLVFSNSNNVSFGLNGSTITASATVSQSTAPNAIAVNAAGSITAGTAVFSNSNGVSFGLNGSTITASVSSVVFSNSNNVSFGLNGSTITATATFAPGAGASMSFWENGALPMTGFTISFTSTEGGGPTTHTGGGMGAAVTNFNNAAIVQRIRVSAAIAVTRIDFVAGDHATIAPLTHSMYPRIYTMAGSTASMVSSSSGTFTCNLSSQNPQAESLAIGTWNLTPGEYMIGLGASYQSGLALFGQANDQGAVTKSYFYDGRIASLSAASFQRSAIANNIGARPYLGMAGTF